MKETLMKANGKHTLALRETLPLGTSRLAIVQNLTIHLDSRMIQIKLFQKVKYLC